MSDTVVVKWRGDAVKAKWKDAKKKMVTSIVKAAVADIRANAPVDTGFMRDSTYGVSESGAEGNPSPRSSRMSSPKYGGTRNYESVGAPARGSADAVIGNGAAYAFWNERRAPFVYPAVERAVSGIAQHIEVLSD